MWQLLFVVVAELAFSLSLILTAFFSEIAQVEPINPS